MYGMVRFRKFDEISDRLNNEYNTFNFKISRSYCDSRLTIGLGNKRIYISPDLAADGFWISRGEIAAVCNDAIFYGSRDVVARVIEMFEDMLSDVLTEKFAII